MRDWRGMWLQSLFVLLFFPFLLAACDPLPDNRIPSGTVGGGGGGVARGGLSSAPPRQGAAFVAPGSRREFLSDVADHVFFRVDSAKLTEDARMTLNEQAEWLKRYKKYRVVVAGHADERGTREYNLALSARRASAVRKYLAKKGVLSSRLRVVAYGKERPLAICSDASCWSQNRRAVTILEGAGRSP